VDDLLDDGADDLGPAGGVAAIWCVRTLFHIWEELSVTRPAAIAHVCTFVLRYTQP
jgi:hypothetical protein